MSIKSPNNSFAMCVDAGEYVGELIVGKAYRLAAPEKGDPVSDVRVIDESGEDYLYPSKWFVHVELPAKVRRVLAGRAVG